MAKEKLGRLGFDQKVSTTPLPARDDTEIGQKKVTGFTAGVRKY